MVNFINVMKNPLLETFFIDTKGKVYHKGQFKQNQFAMKQLRNDKEYLENKLAKLVLHKQTLEKKLSNETNGSKISILKYKISNLDKRIDNTSKMIRTKNGQIAYKGKVLSMMTNTNRLNPNV